MDEQIEIQDIKNGILKITKPINIDAFMYVRNSNSFLIYMGVSHGYITGDVWRPCMCTVVEKPSDHTMSCLVKSFGYCMTRYYVRPALQDQIEEFLKGMEFGKSMKGLFRE